MLQVKDWNTVYETSESRKYVHLTWVKVLNDLHGFGHTRLIKGHPLGSLHWAAWIGIILVASKCNPRGTLVSSAGIALSGDDMRCMTGLDLPFAEAIPRIIELGWLEHVPGSAEAAPGDSPGTSADSPGYITEHNSRLHDINTCATENVARDGKAMHDALKTKKDPSRDARVAQWFDAWWAIYWLAKAKKPALKAFTDHVKTQQRFDEVMAATRAQRPEMMQREPNHRPHGATWLNAERWMDEAAAVKTELEKAKELLNGN